MKKYEGCRSILLPKKKNKGAVSLIACIVLAIITLGIGVIIVVIPKDDYGTIRRVKKLIRDEETAISRYFMDNNIRSYGLSATDGSLVDALLPFEYEKGYMTRLEWSFGIVIELPASDYDNYVKDISKNETFKKTVVDVLEKYGYKKVGKEQGYDWWNEEFYADGDYFCSITSENTQPFYLTCGHKSWVSNEIKKLSKTLSDVYLSSIAEEIDNKEHSLYLNATPDDIQNSKNGYQIITGDISDAAILFYRKGEHGEWKYFTTTQGPISCAFYNTDELKEAYEGERCWLEDGAESTVEK